MISSWPILSIITFLPLCGALFAFFIPSKNDESTNINYNQNIKLLALWTSIMTLIISLLICINFVYGAKDYQFEETSAWIPSLGIMYHLGIDGISFPFILLTTILIPICILCSWNAIQQRIKE